MMEFKIGDRVEIVKSTVEDLNGMFGTIVKRGELNYWKWIVKVDFPGTQSDELGFNEDELELVAVAAPAASSADGVDDSYARGYEAGLLDGYVGVDADWVARFEARQAALEAKLAAAVSALVECTTLMNDHGNDDNWETVTMAYAEAIKRGREVVAQQAAAAPTDGEGE
jgi:hypothetical protein